MQSRSKKWLLPLFLFCWTLRIHCLAAESDERAIWNLWKAHKSATNDHAVAISACRDAEKGLTGSPLLPLSRELQAWHLMKAGDRSGAEALLNQALTGGGTPVEQAAEAIARRWLTRLDRERVKAALKAVYRDRIEYPDSLTALSSLPESQRPPLKDRWGRAWEYQLVALKHVKGLKNQRYLLQCSRLGAKSDLALALQDPFAESTNVVPVEVSVAGASKLVQFRTRGEKPETATIAEGTDFKNLTLAYVGEKILVLSDGDCWYPAAKPGP